MRQKAAERTARTPRPGGSIDGFGIREASGTARSPVPLFAVTSSSRTLQNLKHVIPCKFPLTFPTSMTIELINTGTELLLGRVLNTHQQWICRQMADLGYTVNRQVAIPDTPREIEAAIREALGRADLILTTGGLGPTSDDLTRDLIAGLLNRNLREDPEAARRIEE